MLEAGTLAPGMGITVIGRLARGKLARVKNVAAVDGLPVGSICRIASHPTEPEAVGSVVEVLDGAHRPDGKVGLWRADGTGYTTCYYGQHVRRLSDGAEAFIALSWLQPVRV